MRERVNEYLRRQAARGLSLSRQASSEYALEIFIRWAEGRGKRDWRAVGCSDLRGFLIHLQKEHRAGQPLASGTVKHWFIAVLSFFRWLYRGGHMLHDPGAGIPLPKEERHLPRVLNESEMKLLIESPDVRTALGLRGITLHVTGAARRALAEEGFNPVFGARPMRRVVHREVITPIAAELLRGQARPGDTVEVGHSRGRYRLRIRRGTEPEPPATPTPTEPARHRSTPRVPPRSPASIRPKPAAPDDVNASLI